jgi:hypothetical protein
MDCPAQRRTGDLHALSVDEDVTVHDHLARHCAVGTCDAARTMRRVETHLELLTRFSPVRPAARRAGLFPDLQLGLADDAVLGAQALLLAERTA